jgi:hypothetical protein
LPQRVPKSTPSLSTPFLFSTLGQCSILAEALFPGQRTELSNEWRTRQFEYTWLRTASGRYVDFWQVTGEALSFAAKKIRIRVSRYI